MLFFDCSSGISGDMTIAALLDLGASHLALNKALESLHLHDVSWHYSQHRFEVHASHHHHDHQGHRNLPMVRDIINRGDLTTRARQIALDIFNVVAEAEAKAHHCEIDEVHFHEVGADDSIIDAVSVGVLIDDLNEHEIGFSVLHEGSGQIHCAHGLLNVPVPAVNEIVKKHNIPLTQTDEPTELVTPTGAAIVAALRSECTPQCVPPNWLSSGYGLGSRTLLTRENKLSVYRLI